MNRKNPIWRILIVLIIYLALKYLGGSYSQIILYPVTLLVTFLHELGHGIGAVITGGSVEGLQINQDGSGYTMTRGGSKGVILMGGYIGSAILGNLLFYIGARKEMLAQITLNILAVIMVVVGLIWFNSIGTTIFLVLFALALLFIANKTRFDREVLMFMGLASIVYIIQDFRVGPSSDLEKYAEIFVVIPVSVWMYIWLGIVLILFAYNIRMILKLVRKGMVEDQTIKPL